MSQSSGAGGAREIDVDAIVGATVAAISHDIPSIVVMVIPLPPITPPVATIISGAFVATAAASCGTAPSRTFVFAFDHRGAALTHQRNHNLLAASTVTNIAPILDSTAGIIIAVVMPAIVTATVIVMAVGVAPITVIPSIAPSVIAGTVIALIGTNTPSAFTTATACADITDIAAMGILPRLPIGRREGWLSCIVPVPLFASSGAGPLVGMAVARGVVPAS